MQGDNDSAVTKTRGVGHSMSPFATWIVDDSNNFLLTANPFLLVKLKIFLFMVQCAIRSVPASLTVEVVHISRSSLPLYIPTYTNIHRLYVMHSSLVPKVSLLLIILSCRQQQSRYFTSISSYISILVLYCTYIVCSTYYVLSTY